ncbi:hypothetical protein JS533_005095 [Bifidobacterium amazonense]|uniref:C2H2-type domain-containing protein n=1 Tax=Bifidobacterium amazonense TaxID=2809027 RepID=A0ABS9VU86_9BIFI|nr:hypothetical protein [Bifidobacterium amazonense]MCH9275649.1 hypothetical protein [Bifidobacterium amazonense]
MTATHKPVFKTPKKTTPRKTHRLIRLVPAVLAMLRTRATTVGFGTPTGYVRECACGFSTRDPNRFAQHLEDKIGETIMNNPLAFLDDPTPTLKHRLLDTAKGGRIFICSCGRDFTSLTVMQEHIRAMNEGNADDHE